MDRRLQLYYWDGGNFGDDLNVWLWERLLPDVVNTAVSYQAGSDHSLFVGIGTILSDQLPVKPLKAVFGSGTGYHGLPSVDDNLKIYCVRGPLTAEIIGVDSRFAITDPGILTALVDLPDVRKEYAYSFMPHHESLESLDWKSVCEPIGIHYIDPVGEVEQTLIEIRKSDVVIAEAMHAAIVADALRVQWIPVNLHGSYINTFKWNDWCQSLELEYKPHLPGFGKNARLIKRKLPGIAEGTLKKWINCSLATRVLGRVLREGEPVMSSQAVFDSRITRLQEKMHSLRCDFEAGLFGG